MARVRVVLRIRVHSSLWAVHRWPKTLMQRVTFQAMGHHCQPWTVGQVFIIPSHLWGRGWLGWGPSRCRPTPRQGGRTPQGPLVESARAPTPPWEWLHHLSFWPVHSPGQFILPIGKRMKLTLLSRPRGPQHSGFICLPISEPLLTPCAQLPGMSCVLPKYHFLSSSTPLYVLSPLPSTASTPPQGAIFMQKVPICPSRSSSEASSPGAFGARISA